MFLTSLFAAALMTLTSPEPDVRPVEARVAQGAVVGRETAGVVSFKGLPYAAPPVGALRWRAPQPPQPWRGRRDAGQVHPAAGQRRQWRRAVADERGLPDAERLGPGGA